MRRRLVLVAVLVWAAALSGCAPSARPAARDAGLVRLTFLQVNDDYTIEPVDGGRRGGLARLATLVSRVRAESPHTLFALAGDTISPSVMSTFLRGEQMIAAWNALGLDLATFGNHEFDFGPAVLRDRMRASRFRWISANVLERGTGGPFGGAARDALIALGPITVGVVGLTMAETSALSSPGPDVVFTDPLAAGREAAADLRRRGAHVVVAITHQEMARDRALAAIADVDLVLGGHEHEPLVAEEGRALVTKAGSDGRYLVEVDLWLRPDGRLVERSWAFHEVSDRLAPDPGTATLVDRYAGQLARELDVAIARTEVPLEARRDKLRSEETNTGDLFADLVRERMGAEVAVVNGGAVRSDRVLPAGPITKRDVHAFLPFGNVVMTLAMRGDAIRRALEQGLAQREHGGGGFLQISGVRLTYDPRRPAGQRLVDVMVGGRPLDEARTYTVAAIDYLVRGGDGLTAFGDGRILVDAASGPQLAATVLDGIAARGTIAPVTDGRIRALGP